jgi:hypothetical protein
VAVLRNSHQASGIGKLGAIQAVAPSFGVELTPVAYRDADDIERGIAAFVRGPTDGLIVTASGGMPQIQRDTIIALAANHRLPAVYLFRTIGA